MAVQYLTVASGATVSAVTFLATPRPLAVFADSHAGGQVFFAFGVTSAGPFARVKAAGGLDLAVTSGSTGWGTLTTPVSPWFRVEQSVAAATVRSFQVWTT